MNETDFGFKTIPLSDKAKAVGKVFSSVAAKYDLMNDLMSFGIHRYWKNVTINAALLSATDHVLDVAGGTGDLTARFYDRVGARGKIVLSDINSEMLNVGRDRLINQGIGQNIDYVQADAEFLPFPDNHFDCVSIAFGLRNVARKEKALASMHRVLKPGGRLLVLEFSKPVLSWLEKLYDVYSFHLLPKLGEWIAKDADSYQYLVESIRRHPDQETLKQMTLSSGFDHCEYFNLTGGIVALHRAFKY